MAKVEDLTMDLRCSLLFSKSVEDIRGDLSRLISEANKSLFLKGVPQGKEDRAAKATLKALKGNTAELEITSSTYVRAPAALLRLLHFLREDLGKKHKLGVRDVSVSDLTTRLPLTGDVGEEALTRIRGFQNTRSASLEGRNLVIRHTNFTLSDFERGSYDRLLKMVEEELGKAAEPEVSAPPMQIVRQGEVKPIKFDKDPAETALKLGWITRFPGRGQWIYGPPYAALYEIIEDTLVEGVAKKLGFQPCLLPKLIPFDVMKLMPGYFDGIPEGMYYVCPPPREPESFKDFKESFKIHKDVPAEELRKILKDPEYVLAPAQCEPFWYLFHRKSIKELPIKLYDRSGWTYRWEGGGVEGLVRVQEFRRIELVYYGLPDEAVKIRDAVLEENRRISDDLLDLEWRIVTSIPFFSRKTACIMDVHDSRQVSAYDLETYMPYRGPRNKAEWLEITACFVHRTKFINAFKIKEEKSQEIWSGCTGMGVSRWVAAFLARHGFDVDNWPRSIKQRYIKYGVKVPR